MRAAALATVLLTAAPAEAVWNHTREIVHGTASTLEQGELLVGVITPISYGINDSLQVQLHPILWALLTPNAGLRFRLLDGDIFSLSIESEASVTSVDEQNRPDDPRPLAHIYGGLAGTFSVGGGVLISLRAGYQHDFSEKDGDTTVDDDDFVWSGGVNWLIGPSHLLLATGGAQYSSRRGGLKAPFGSIMYAYGFDSGSRIGVGVAFGSFPIPQGKDEGDGITLPVWPIIDWWKRF